MLVRMWDTQRGEVDVQMPTVPSGAAGPPGGFPAGQEVLAAWVNTVTSDPGVNQDSTQGYSVGSMVLNTTAGVLRLWECRDATAGAAKWVFAGADYASGGTNPVSETTQFGGVTSLFVMAEEGNLFRSSSAAATGIGANAADTTDDILGGIRLPAGAFDAAGRGLCITAQGKFGATANNKRFRLFLNPTMSGQTLTNGVYSNAGTVTAGTAVFDSGTQTGNNVGWGLTANLFKYGAAGANTQYFQASPIFGATHGGITLPSAQTLTESATIDIVVTGASQTTGAANDVVLNFLEINGMN